MTTAALLAPAFAAVAPLPAAAAQPLTATTATTTATASTTTTTAAATTTLAKPLVAAPSDKSLAAAPDRHDLTREQYYFVLPDRFANGDTGNDTGGITGSRMDNGLDPTDSGFYHGGDLKGLIGKLDYIKKLGTTAIWMAPIFKNMPVQGTGSNASAGYHGYWITDFTQVDPHFGTNAQLKELIQKAHAMGMKVFFDVITNHTADVIDYAEKTYDYRSTGAYPTLDAGGRPVDTTAMADANALNGTSLYPKLTTSSFPYTPIFNSPANSSAKSPSWLNDPTLYHNRGNSTFTGESGTEGDFSGLDDLDTQNPKVVKGMEQIYEDWVRNTGVDGFRIDTVKNVDMAFWEQWAPTLKAYAAARGNKNFFMFGEVYDSDTSTTSSYVTQGKLQATLDFPFQSAAQTYAADGGSAKALSAVYGNDYKYTTADTNAYELPTFLGNHDMGRVGYFIQSANPGDSNAQLLKKDQLAQQLQFLTRGQPVVYYGDEQGFTGSGGDKAARQDMFASQTASYNTGTVIGGTSGSADRYSTSTPLYSTISTLAALRKANPALENGAQVERYAADGPGVYAFSRIDEKQQVEYLVAVNNATTAQSVSVPTYSAGMTFDPIYGGAVDAATTGGDSKLAITVPAQSAVVYQATERLAAPTVAPSVTLTAPAAGSTRTVTVAATVPGTGFDRVTFAAAVGDGKWQTLGTADHAPYQVTENLANVANGTTVRYKAVVEDSAGRLADATGSTTVGTVPPVAKPTATSRTYAVVHYHRADGDYSNWNLYAWGDIADGESTTWPAGHPFIGRDAFGAFAYVKLKAGASNVGFIVEDNGTKDGAADRSIDLSSTGEVWVNSGDTTTYTTDPGATSTVPAGTAVIHYHRTDGNYTGWGLHDWTGAATPTDWSNPLSPSGTDAFGDVFTVPLASGATVLDYIIHNGDTKDLPDNQELNFAVDGREVWITDSTPGYILPQSTASAADLDLSRSKAQWIDGTTVAVPASWGFGQNLAAGASAEMVYCDSSGGDPRTPGCLTGALAVKDGDLTDPGYWLRLLPVSTGLTAAQLAAHPELKRYAAFTVDPRDTGRITTALRGQLIMTEREANGALLAATGVQIPGVLDAVYATKAVDATLGPVVTHTSAKLSVWAPTAQSVSLELYDSPSAATGRTVAMRRDDRTGIWSATGPASWKGKYYLYQVKVWAPSVQKIVTNQVTDPYSLALSADSERSEIVDLDDSSTAPSGWSGDTSPKALTSTQQEIQELHVSDFSSADTTVPAADRGTYLAFNDLNSDGMKHLAALARSGVTTVHLLPTFDFSSVPESKSEQSTPACDLASYAPDSQSQQACVSASAATDDYNWGYDPYHFTVPEGSYATDADGTARTVQFRQMVAALHRIGLRVVMDVVYNHTAASGEAATSVLDRIVPGYYQRLSATGAVTTDSCCADTAPEHTMMNKLVVDSTRTWADEYHVDGFRFDLMGLDPKQTMLDVRSSLKKTGRSEFLYGEGWNFGVVANDARFVQATQANMAGTGIATFNDRQRDAVRGGGPFDTDPRIQGFASGLYTDPNGAAANGTAAQQKANLLHAMDQLKVGLTGDLASYSFTDSGGRTVKGSEVDYNGSPTGYTDAPGEAVTYVDAHDNLDLYDALTYKLPAGTSMADRARMQSLALATTALSQGPGFAVAGSDLLRSKSLDANSYDSGDWFNAIHWNCGQGNGFGHGLPLAASNQASWTFAQPLLARTDLVPGCAAEQSASAQYQQFLQIKKSTPLFSLTTAAEVQQRLSYPLSGTPGETPGVITLHLDGSGLHTYTSVTVVFNATPTTQKQTLSTLAGTAQQLHPAQADGSDAVVRTSAFDPATGTFTIPARTVAVFVQQ
ncbi:pullulanase-type alpha-1,6-glucosidase [Streptacidiphilus carbonis]|uniref:pullulanase-type alpha-1,6-glucosidase n=1 Tax=Streptacidiphilus carbonis TaxID=105422 RepID=UPI000AF81EC0|nr:pullulanase-type alpha-1,6-glucosidase [Streptacidiphilus carbonis]